MVKHLCTDKFENDGLYHISKGDEKYVMQDSLGTILLPDTGTYILHLYTPHFYSINTDSLILEINEYKGYSDTLTAKVIIECFEPVSHPSFVGFCCCGLNKCNGYQVDYHPNEQKSIEGRFKDGFPIGKLSYYYPSGEIREIRFYDKKGKGRVKKTIYYDIKGQQVKK